MNCVCAIVELHGLHCQTLHWGRVIRAVQPADCLLLHKCPTEHSAVQSLYCDGGGMRTVTVASNRVYWGSWRDAMLDSVLGLTLSHLLWVLCHAVFWWSLLIRWLAHVLPSCSYLMLGWQYWTVTNTQFHFNNPNIVHLDLSVSIRDFNQKILLILLPILGSTYS